LRQLQEQLHSGGEIWGGGSAASAHRRVLPGGVGVLAKAGEVSAQVRTWRQRHSEAGL